ncbi:leaf rust 10 disease-resistance locus receptor-like protein kinase-like 2.1 protein isoform X1 [Tanacetum coccineum]
MGMECLHGSDSPATHSTLPPPLLRHIPFPTYPSLFEKQKLLAKLPMGWYPMRHNNQFLGYFTPISVIHWIVICLVEDLVQSQLIRTFCLASTFYDDCAPQNCGDGMNVSFPFYIRVLQHSYCGYPGFELDCNSNGSSLIIQISGNNYSVEDINYEDQLLQLRNSPVTTCPLAIKNLTIDNNNVNFKLRSWNVVFLMSCDLSQLPNKNLTRYRIGSCDQLVMNEYDMNLGIAMEVCSQTVVAPVELEDYTTVVDGGNYTEVMKRGFKLVWNLPTCSTCNQSGGRCGYSYFQHYCFCPNSERTLLPKVCRIALIVGVVMISVVVFLCFKKKLRQRRRTKNSVNIANFLKNHEFLDPKKYSYSQVKKMTNSFKVKLGQGGFGSVYKGELSNGNLVAVKILSEVMVKILLTKLQVLAILAMLISSILWVSDVMVIEEL